MLLQQKLFAYLSGGKRGGDAEAGEGRRTIETDGQKAVYTHRRRAFDSTGDDSDVSD